MLSRFLRSSKPAIPSGQRVYAIGDIHGRADLLDQLLEMLQRHNSDRGAADTTLVFLGDLIDRGPESRKVVSRVRAGVAWARSIALMGNHEAVMLDVLDRQLDTLTDWLRFGGRETLASWGISQEKIDSGTRAEIVDALQSAVTQEERAWLSRMRKNLRIGDYYFVHAGIRPDVPLDRQTDEDRLWIRNDFLESRKRHGAMIVHGHSITAAVDERSNRIGLDTGAYISGRLTALCLEETERCFIATNS